VAYTALHLKLFSPAPPPPPHYRHVKLTDMLGLGPYIEEFRNATRLRSQALWIRGVGPVLSNWPIL